jgi:hypothetical protein
MATTRGRSSSAGTEEELKGVALSTLGFAQAQTTSRRSPLD